jgi:steroid delta-isomerase
MKILSRRGRALATVATLMFTFAGVPAAYADPSDTPDEQAIRKVLTDWMLAFNAGDTGSVCRLFAPELRYDYRGFPERGFAEVCGVLQGSLADRTRKFSYDLTIKEVIVSGDLAVVRLVWTLTSRRPGQVGGTSANEPGLDVLRRQPDGGWKIVRYLAYEE